MSNWVEMRLSEIAEINPHEVLKKGAVAKKVPMDKLQPYCRDIPEFIIEPYSGGAKFRNGDTIMARITPCLENGKIAQVNILDENEVGFGSTEYIVFRARKGNDADFIYYLVSSSLVKEPAIKSMVGSSGRQRVQIDVIQNLLLKVPELKTQRAIASILKGLDDKIGENNKVNHNLQQQAQVLYHQMFCSMPHPDWRNGVLSDIADIVMGQSPDGKSYNEDGIGTVFYQGRAEFGTRFPTQRLFTTEPKRMAQENDVLISVRAPVGDLNVAKEDCCIGRGLGAVRSKDGHQSFVLYTMFALRSQLNVFNGEGTVFGSINRDSLNSLPVIIPPITEINKFEALVAPMDKAIRTNHDEICHLQSLRDALLPRLMSGEIDVSEVKL